MSNVESSEEAKKAILVAGIMQEEVGSLTELEFIPPRSLLSSKGVTASPRLSSCLNAESSYSLTARGAAIDFREPAFVSSIHIYGDAKKVKLFAKLPDGKEFQIRGGLEDKSYNYSCRKIITGIKLETEDDFFRKKTAEIKKINIFQWGVSEFDMVTEALDKALSVNNELEEKRTTVKAEIDSAKLSIEKSLALFTDKVSTIELKLAEYKEDEAAIAENIGKLTADEALLKSKTLDVAENLSSIESRVAEKVSREESLNQIVEEKKLELNSLILEASTVKNQLKEFEKSANLFPDDLKGFAERAGKTKVAYYVLSVVPLLLLSCFSLSLFLSADSLAGLTVMKLDELYSHLLQRLPYVAIVSTIIGGSFAFLGHVVKRIEEVHQQEMNLSKISIVARDISNSEYASEDEDLQKQERLKLKIEMVQNYLFAEIARSEKELNKDSIRYQDLTLFDKFKSLIGIGNGMTK